MKNSTVKILSIGLALCASFIHEAYATPQDDYIERLAETCKYYELKQLYPDAFSAGNGPISKIDMQLVHVKVTARNHNVSIREVLEVRSKLQRMWRQENGGYDCPYTILDHVTNVYFNAEEQRKTGRY